MKLARAWARIAHHLDNRLEQLAVGRRLTWMPAHQPASAIGTARKSTGNPVTAIDWRANHLVDGLAKKAAAEGAATEQERMLVESAELLVKHCAGQLAAVTHSANNYREQYLDDKGIPRTRCKRGSQEIPKTTTKKLKPLKALVSEKPKPPLPATTSSSSDSESSQGPSARSRRRTARAAAKLSAELTQKAAFDAVLQTKRMSHREAVLDLHRRRGVAATLIVAPDPPGSNLWTSFLDAQPEVDREEPPFSDEPGGPTEVAVSGGSSRAYTFPAVPPASDSRPEQEVHPTPNLEAAAQTATRHRPTRGDSGITKAASRAAVNALLGRPTKSQG